jgi:hypothetical protein
MHQELTRDSREAAKEILKDPNISLLLSIDGRGRSTL